MIAEGGSNGGIGYIKLGIYYHRRRIIIHLTVIPNFQLYTLIVEIHYKNIAYLITFSDIIKFDYTV